jgi:predicted ribosomally synthesized peptide with nif11-like leader
MSAQAALQFMDKLAANPDLLKQIEKDTAGKDDTAAVAAVVAAGKAQGFDFTAADVQTGATVCLKHQSGEELTDEELAQIAGGVVSPTIQAAAAAVAQGQTFAQLQTDPAFNRSNNFKGMLDFMKRMALMPRMTP